MLWQDALQGPMESEFGHEARSHAMSMIPTGALGDALAPVQRSTHESLRARQVQLRKNSHHNQDVEELDDTAVNSVRDQNQRQGRQSGGDQNAPRQTAERVEIEALDPSTPQPAPEQPPAPSHLDISA